LISLTSRMNRTIEYHGREYAIDLSFDNVLRFFELLDDPDFSQQEKILTAFEMFFIDKVSNIDADFILRTVQIISEYVSSNPYGSGAGGSSDFIPERYFSYTKDADAIYASFMQCYGISLTRELYKTISERLQWDEFKALFNGLADDTYIRRIINIRQRSTEGLQGQELSSLLEAKDYYALDDDYNAEMQTKRADDMFESLYNMARNGGN
jgi:hypothetical protein